MSCIVNKFEKVSFEQYLKDSSNNIISDTKKDYDNIILPKRATKYSAGYDIFSPINFMLAPGESIKFPTGIKVKIKNNCFLGIFPRSSLGFKYKLQIDNTVGIIDSDYYNNKSNEGHIWIKLTNDSRDDKLLIVNKGDAIAQGIFMYFDVTINDNSDGERIGGLGSTNEID